METRGAPELEFPFFFVEAHTRAVDIGFDLASLCLYFLSPLPDGTFLPLAALALPLFGALFNMRTSVLIALGVARRSRSRFSVRLEICIEEFFS